MLPPAGGHDTIEVIRKSRRWVAAKGTAAVLRQVIRSVEKLGDQPAHSDQELLRRFTADNDQAAFASLVRRYRGRYGNSSGPRMLG
jgi:hypothetical protein